MPFSIVKFTFFTKELVPCIQSFKKMRSDKYLKNCHFGDFHLALTKFIIVILLIDQLFERGGIILGN